MTTPRRAPPDPYRPRWSTRMGLCLVLSRYALELVGNGFQMLRYLFTRNRVRREMHRLVLDPASGNRAEDTSER